MELKPDGRYIIITDMHGNYEAFKKAFEDAIAKYGRLIDGFIFLGDYVCDYPWGYKVVELLTQIKEKYPVAAISGNREIGMVRKFYEATKNHFDENGHISIEQAEKLTGWSLETSMGAPLYDCCRMTKKQIEFLCNIPETQILENENDILFLKHKTPLLPDELAKLKSSPKRKILLVGHTHEAHNKVYDGIRHINPGAIALCDSGIPGAFYGVYERGKFILHQVEYDYDKVIAELRKNQVLYDKCENWGHWLEESILTGINAPTIYANEKKRLVNEFKSLNEKEAKTLIGLNIEEALVLAKTLLPILTLDDKPFSRNRYGNTNPHGKHLIIDTFIATDDGMVNIEGKNFITNDIDDESKINDNIQVNNNCEVPMKLIIALAKEYTDEYLKHANQYIIGKDRVR